MELNVKDVSQSEQQIDVTLSYEEIKPEIDEAYAKESKNISIPGFRKGKAPRNMVKKLYGEAIEYKATEDIAQKKFWEVVEQENLEPVSTPQLIDIDFKPGEQLSFSIKYEIKPNLDVKDYTGQDIEKPVFKLKEEEVERELDYLLKNYATYEEAEKIEDENYKIKVDLQRLDDEGKEMEGQKSEGVDIDLSNPQVNPEMVENAKGKAKGETFNFEFVDEHSHGDHVHKVEYKYLATVTQIEKVVLPEIDEEFLKKVSKKDAKTEDELKEELRANFEDYYKQQSENIFQNALIKQVVDNNDFEPPKGYVENVYKNLVEREKQNAARSQQQFNENAAAGALWEQAVWNTKWQIVMENLAEKENIKVEDADLEELAKQDSEKMGISAEKLVRFYKESNRTAQLLEEKVVKFLKEKNNAVEVDAEEKAKQEQEAKEKEAEEAAKQKDEEDKKEKK